MKKRFMAIALVTITAFVWNSSAEAARSSWSRYGRRDDAWFRSDEGRRVVNNVLSYQTKNGDWPKNMDLTTRPYRGGGELHGTFDNGATRGEMRLLARAFKATGEERYEAAFLKALDHVLAAQYENGGWPQSSPARGYSRHITFNDGTMVGLMELMRDVATKEEFDFVDDARRKKAREAFDRGIDCILRCQIVVDGERTAWCAQHDEKTLAPAAARSYEHPSISGGESAGIVHLLMSIEEPSPEDVRAVDAACRWYERSKLTGIRLARQDGDRVVVSDPDAPPLWARFYEIATNRPIFSGRDGVIKYKYSEIEPERRNGYAWYVSSGKSVLEEWPEWRAQHVKTRNGDR